MLFFELIYTFRFFKHFLYGCMFYIFSFFIYIVQGHTAYLVYHLRGFRLCVLLKVHKLFDFRYNEDFRSVTKEETDLMRRGGVLYRDPFGWKCFSIRAAGKYDNGDDTWMSNWAVAYHGLLVKAWKPFEN